MGINDNIKILRDMYGLSQKDLGRIAGVSDKAVSTWEQGTKEPRMGAIQKIADYFGLQKSNIIEDGGLYELTAEAHEPQPDEAEMYHWLPQVSDIVISQKPTPKKKIVIRHQTPIQKYAKLTPSNRAMVDKFMDFLLYEQAKALKKHL